MSRQIKNDSHKNKSLAMVEVKNACKSYGKEKVLDNFCMNVDKGTM